MARTSTGHDGGRGCIFGGGEVQHNLSGNGNGIALGEIPQLGTETGLLEVCGSWGGVLGGRGRAGGWQPLFSLLGAGGLQPHLQPRQVRVQVALEDGAGADEGSLQGPHEAPQAQILPCKEGTADEVPL